MTTQIAIIDPFVKAPAVNCFNNLVNLLGIPASYHMPSALGIGSLLKEKDKSQGYIVLGSASHVHENLPWHAPLADFLVSELKAGKPVLGCCFGHQLICHALGAKVEFYDQTESKQMGSRLITIQADALSYKAQETFQLAVTHKQVVRDLPALFTAIGHGLENDIVIHKELPFMGTQAHPEASAHFCVTDINNLSPAEISVVQQDGSRLIQRFFQHFKLI